MGQIKKKNCNKLQFSNPFIFATQCRRPLIFQDRNSVILNNQSLKYQRFTIRSQDIRIRAFEFVTSTQFLCVQFPQLFLIYQIVPLSLKCYPMWVSLSYIEHHSPLKPAFSSVRVLQIAIVRTKA